MIDYIFYCFVFWIIAILIFHFLEKFKLKESIKRDEKNFVTYVLGNDELNVNKNFPDIIKGLEKNGWKIKG